MDITSTTTGINTNTLAATIKTPEAESEIPTRIQPAKPLSFSNGVLKRHHPLHLHAVVVTYKECLKNHAATLGGHAVDGCGEFMPSPNSNPTDPTSLKCAACGCHRNFHRREPEEPLGPPNATAALEYQPHHRHHPPPPHPGSGGHSSPSSPSPPPISSAFYPSASHMLLALSGGVDNNTPISAAANTPGSAFSNPNSRKRFRTKFTQNQKEKMLEFAESIGWKIQKRDDESISGFCNEIGVDKGVLKVWMHNNKNTLGKKDPNSNISSTPTPTPTPTTKINNSNGIGTSFGTAAAGTTATHYHHRHNDNNGEGLSLNHLHNSDNRAHMGASTNGSSSSS